MKHLNQTLNTNEKDTRGTDALVGETVAFVDTYSINVIHIHCKSGKVVSIDAEEQHYGIPVVQVADYTEFLWRSDTCPPSAGFSLSAIITHTTQASLVRSETF